MPIFEYKCQQCNYTGEVLREFDPYSLVPVVVCPECNGEMKRVVGVFARTPAKWL